MKLSVLLAVALIWPAAAQETSPVSEWIASHAIRLNTPEAGHGFSDMQPLKQAIGNARIVSLGEATHGTREFFQLKHRMLEFLASEMGFTIFSIEANMPEAYRLNDYVLTGRGDPAELLRGMYFWTWDTEEVLDMIRWMREFNKSGKGPVQFTGFDMQTPTVAEEIVAGFVAKNDPSYAAAVKSASELAAKTGQTQGGPAFGIATGTFPVSAAAGKKIRFSGFIKTENVTNGFAGLWWRVDGPSGVLAFDNMQSRGVQGTTDWKEYSIELPVAADATNINFGAIFPGTGSAWFDDFRVELDGVPYKDDSQLDFGFESSSPKGFYTGGNGYRVQLDTKVFHSGKQSLSMSGAPLAGANKPTPDPKFSAAAWADIVGRLEASREQYRQKGAADREIEWAIQNARLVEQCLRLRGNPAVRDPSMAANVKWILDQSPGAKMVVWAHNGHVETSNGSMGSALRQMYGSQMVVFSFAFNRGSFQSVAPGRGLRQFTVPPAPAGSLDATLAASGIPLFALDLRSAPKTGLVADWLHTAHATRSIGAMYAEETPTMYFAQQVAPDVCDVLLFVEKTTAARANPGGMGKTFDFQRSGASANGVNEFRDPEFAVSVQLPQDWKVGEAFRWGDHETTARVIGPDNWDGGRLYYKIGRNPATSAEEYAANLLAQPEAKAAQRVASGLSDYRIRQASVTRRTVGGRPALTCVADFTRDGAKWVEYLTWVSGQNASALFFAQVKASELDALRQRIDPIIDSLALP